MQFTSLEVHKKRRKCCEPNCMFTPGATKAINLLKKKKKHSYDVTMAMSLVELFLTFFFFFSHAGYPCHVTFVTQITFVALVSRKWIISVDFAALVALDVRMHSKASFSLVAKEHLYHRAQSIL